jgi:molybdopterin-guanine dinucleotide biosynthesis protein A
MGSPKADLRLDGETLAARTARVLASVCEPVLEVGPGHTRLPHVREEPAGGGPVAALVAGWEATGRPDSVLLLACDLPFVDEAVVRLLATWPGAPTAVPVAGERLQPLCARFGADAVDAARLLLADGERSFRALLDAIPFDRVSEAEWRRVAPANALADVDTPADAQRFGVEHPR